MPPALGVHLFEGELAQLGADAARMESLGFASITVSDHLRRAATAPLTSCAVIAAATDRVRFGPLVLNNDLRHPVVLAREAAALADLSGGRFELGLGAGYARAEYERAGIPFAPRRVRAARLAESARILRALLAGETVDFEGEHYVVRGDSIALEHRVPLLIGGNSAEVHAAAAASADAVGLIGFSPGPKDERLDGPDFTTGGAARQVERLRELAGARFGELELHALVQWHEVSDDSEAAVARAAAALAVPPAVVLDSPYVLVGTPAEIADRLRELHERLGIVRWTVFGNRSDLQGADAVVPVLELLRGA